jgi:hypothetical protein
LELRKYVAVTRAKVNKFEFEDRWGVILGVCGDVGTLDEIEIGGRVKDVRYCSGD